MPIYTKQDIQELKRELTLVHPRYEELLLAYHNLQLANPLAREMARQGFIRRLKTLSYCVNIVFKRIAPGSEKVPKEAIRKECEVCIQSFVFNVFGCLDNLAIMWVKERNITRPDGKRIPPLLIGFSKKCVDVRASLSREMQDYLSECSNWFSYIEDYRHALAHRIPLYIPPHSVKRSNATAYQDLEAKKGEARRRWDMDEHDRLEEEQKKLIIFQPYINHSWENDMLPIRFHERLLGDYITVVDFGRRMLRELKQPV